MSNPSIPLQRPEEAPTAHATHIVLDRTQPFPKFLENSWTMLESLSMDAVEFGHGQFRSLLSSRRLMAGLQNLVVLKVENILNFPPIVLSSCVQLQELVFRNVLIRNDASLVWSLPGPRLMALTCSRVLEQTYRELVCIVDVTHLRSFECELVEHTPQQIGYGPNGPQYILDRCRNTLEILTLHSDNAFPSCRENYWLYLCDLSQLVILRCLVFITSVQDFDCSRPHRPHILDQVLATISQQTRTLELLEYRTTVCIDDKLIQSPGGSILLDTSTVLEFFQTRAWQDLDRAVARVASGRIMRFNVDVYGWIGREKRQAYNPINAHYDSRALGALMKKWGEHIFVSVREQQQIDFAIDAQIVERTW